MVLVVAATRRELEGADGALTVCCGVGPVEAAAATMAALHRHRPSAVLHVGIAGARRASGIRPPAVVIGTEARYCDLTYELAPRVSKPATALVSAATLALPGALTVPIGTSARVGGSTGCDVEAMEGFAVLRAAEIAGVPAIEIRIVANEIEEADRSKWCFDEALDTLASTLPRVLAALARFGATRVM